MKLYYCIHLEATTLFTKANYSGKDGMQNCLFSGCAKFQ